MNSQVRQLVTLACSAVVLSAIGGCEDSSARQRNVVQVQLREAGAKLDKALAQSSAVADPASAQPFNAVVNDLAKVEGGAPGQQAAKAMLAATALREIATINLARAQQVESSQREARTVIRGQLDAMLRLDAGAAGLESVTAKAEREELQKRLSTAKGEVTALSEKITQLDGPIAERAEKNATQSQEVKALRVQVGELIRKAQELGHANGFETYQHAAEVGRKADKIDYEIAQREIELDYSLAPEHKLADAQVKQLRLMVQAIEAADALLGEFAKATAKDAQDTRQHISELARAVTESMGSLSKQSASDLQPAYEEAAAALQKAASQAQTAVRSSSGDDAQAVRLLAIQIAETQGRANWAKALGLADHKALLERLANAAAVLPDGTNVADELNAVGAAQAQAIEEAKLAYTSVQESLGQVQIRSDPGQIDACSKRVEAALAALEGKFAEPEPVPPPAGAGPIAAPAAPREGRFATAEELYKYLKSLPKNLDGSRAAMAVIRADTPDGRRLRKASTDMLDAMASVDQAMHEKFNRGIMDTAGSMLATMTPDLSKATVSEQSDDKVVYTIIVMGQTNRTVLRKIDGSWWVDLDDMDQQTKAALPMAEAMAAALSKNVGGLVARIRAGEFKTAEEAFMAFSQTMAAGMGGMGGLPRVPNPPPPPPGGAEPGK